MKAVTLDGYYECPEHKDPTYLVVPLTSFVADRPSTWTTSCSAPGVGRTVTCHRNGNVYDAEGNQAASCVDNCVASDPKYSTDCYYISKYVVCFRCC